ncbi:MAG TPA: bifunctional diaminohydroxyphosphoribosylaminopyrimidine deaminase/5-amino-6-(5-phosphoribosylamino)uracil reductase RibD [Membranihabitans sp.]|nr:bifunctional diaminohydroxyphosphoribosylaminopyrimidine deaminase/5-amino-6-(5-phosphoribosylamino)uracil reductase RibD [Membranihabitans sp.]
MADRFEKIIIRRCNELALRSLGRTGTNPNVGSVVVDESTRRILGEGWHQNFGGPHAEVNAMENAKTRHDISHKTIAVSLEPCNHTGKTPPCTTAILDNKLSGVWVDQIDPDPRMGGQSFDLLEKSGAQLSPAFDSPEGTAVLRPFRIGKRTKRPFIRLKMAVSQDDFIGQKGKQIKISNEICDRWVHRMRHETQAIMAGTSTILNDDPSLTSRYGNRHHPVRIIPDRQGILPNHLKVFDENAEKIVCTISHRTDYPARILKSDPRDLHATFHHLYQNFDIGSIFIEGGSRIFDSLFEGGLWDELILIQNTELYLNSGVKAPRFPWKYLRQKIIFGSNTINFIINPTIR